MKTKNRVKINSNKKELNIKKMKMFVNSDWRSTF